MATREEIEAAYGRRSQWIADGRPNNSYEVSECPYDADALADAYLAERAERQQRIEAAAKGIIADCNTHDMYRDLIVHIITRCLDGETT